MITYRIEADLVPVGVLTAASTLARRVLTDTDWTAVQITITPETGVITFDVQAAVQP